LRIPLTMAGLSPCPGFVFLLAGLAQMVHAQTPTPAGNRTTSAFRDQDYQPAKTCLPCHQRQYDELRSAVKSGYRNVSPLFNSLEVAGNLVSGGLLRPVYKDSTIVLPDGTPLDTNNFTSPVLTKTRQVQAGFCFTCHNPHIARLGEDPTKREVPQLPSLGANFRPDLIRPLRDYQLVDASGKQVLPAEIGGPPPAGAQPSLGASGITCDVCHNVAGPDLNRSFQRDGFANMSLKLDHSIEKVGPFAYPVAVKDNFHVSSNDPDKIAFLRSPAFCATCHDVRVPNRNYTAEEHNMNPGGESVNYYRLENLSTEWQLGPYNGSSNPFGKVVSCQDCHMSRYPFAGDSTYQVGDMKVTSPTPAVYFNDYAAVPGVSTAFNYPLQKRKVVSHYFTGIDVPLLSTEELRARLGSDYPDIHEAGTDEHGIPKSLETRREDLLKASVRISLDKTDATAQAGKSFMVRTQAVALTGHSFPSGFSQERTAYLQLRVTDDNGLLLYQSGYVVDKPHPDTGEMQPDGNMDDEDLEHAHVVVDPGRHTEKFATGPATNGHTNLIFEDGPDSGPESRVYTGAPEGLVLLRNELTHIFLPGDSLGRKDANGTPIVVTKPHFEETFSAGFANSVDNFRALSPLAPTIYRYEVQLPTAEELQLMGADSIKGPLHVHAQVNFEHFPPEFMRFLASTTGPNGPTGHDLHLVNEQLIDNYLKNITNIAEADFTVNLLQ
jgi:hypothetical protein